MASVLEFVIACRNMKLEAHTASCILGAFMLLLPPGALGFALGCAGVLVLALVAPSGKGLGALLRIRPLRAAGQYSYALYIFHHPIAIYLGGPTGVALDPSFLWFTTDPHSNTEAL